MERTKKSRAGDAPASRNGRSAAAHRNGRTIAAAPRRAAHSNGSHPSRKVRVAIVGVGNCASSLVQGRYFYENASPDDFVPGLMHVELGGYHIRDIEFVAAFDIAKNKVGKDLSEAIYAKPNNTYVFHKVPHLGVTVERGMTHDGLGKYLGDVIEKAPGPTADIVGILRERKVDVVVSYLPVGSEEATKWYVEQCLRAGVGFVNAIPVFIGREPYWQRRFAEAGVPIIGDDIKSQVGATISHRVLTRLFMDRGVRLDRTYQLNFGGNTDFLNMLERERLESKKISKTNAVTSMLDYDMAPDDVHVGPSDYVPWLKDRKWCYIRMEGTTFGDVPLNLELKLEVWDSPNSAGVIIDAVRCLKLGLDRGLAGTLVAPSSYFMKSPPRQIPDEDARELVEAFIRGDDATVLNGTETADSPAWSRRTRGSLRGRRTQASEPARSAKLARGSEGARAVARAGAAAR
jgi:myo-inositol-1-phosphate synthase